MKLFGILALILSVMFIFYSATYFKESLHLIKQKELIYKDSDGKQMNVKLYSLSDKSLDFIKAIYKHRYYTLPHVVSANGARYSIGQGIQIWIVGDKLHLEDDNNKMDEELLLEKTTYS